MAIRRTGKELAVVDTAEHRETGEALMRPSLPQVTRDTRHVLKWHTPLVLEFGAPSVPLAGSVLPARAVLVLCMEELKIPLGLTPCDR